jgi:hypothetical protein
MSIKSLGRENLKRKDKAMNVAKSLLLVVVLGNGTLFAQKSGTVSSADAFMKNLRALCGLAFEGTFIEGNPSDESFRNQKMVMHVRSCGEGLRIPFHVGENRSRTWVLTRTEKGLRLKHDHRHEDGTPDSVTQYGGDTQEAGSAMKQEFHADVFTGTMIPYAATNIWTIEIVPGQRMTYSLRRENRRFRVDFDLTLPVQPPPVPWGTKED